MPRQVASVVGGSVYKVRVVSWNLQFRRPETAKRQGDLLRQLAPDLMLLQELNPGSAAVLRDAAGADWMIGAIDLRTPEPNESPGRRRGVAIAGHGVAPCRSWLLDGIRLSERTLFIETQTADGTPFIAASYHAPPGVTWGIVKPQQVIAFASWLSTQNGLLLFGADANTPLIDAVDLANTRTHWHTGNRHLNGEAGDDLLFGPCKTHDLDDALRRWLAHHPDEMNRLGTSKPFGPLAVTHRTGKRKNSPGTGRRFDSVWVSRHWVVRHIEHLYEEGIAAGSDHAPVMVDFDLMARPGTDGGPCRSGRRRLDGDLQSVVRRSRLRQREALTRCRAEGTAPPKPPTGRPVCRPRKIEPDGPEAPPP